MKIQAFRNTNIFIFMVNINQSAETAQIQPDYFGIIEAMLNTNAVLAKEVQRTNVLLNSFLATQNSTNAPTAPKEYYSFKEACQFLNLSKIQLYRAVQTKEIVYYKHNNKLLFFKEVDMRNYLDSVRLNQNEPSVTNSKMQSSNYFVKSKI